MVSICWIMKKIGNNTNKNNKIMAVHEGYEGNITNTFFAEFIKVVLNEILLYLTNNLSIY